MNLMYSLLISGALLGAWSPASAGEVLSDGQLDQITAGTASAVYNDGRLYFDLEKTTGRGTVIGATGNASLNLGSAAINTGVLQLQDNAQGNLRALVNTNAVNSPVQVLINLNINIDSRIGALNQINNALQQK